MKKNFLLSLFFAALQTYSVAQSAPPFWNDIVAFKKLDSVQPHPAHPIVFVGSSSFTRWKNVNDYFPGYPIINRGFGGSTLLDLIRYTYDVILPYQPEQVVIYSGENDLAYSDTLSAADVVKRFRTLYAIIRLNLPGTIIDYVSIKPSPLRKNVRTKVIESNKEIRAFLKKEKNAGYIDIYTAMIDASGNPRPALFMEDSLHMKPEGYAIWGKLIQPYLVK